MEESQEDVNRRSTWKTLYLIVATLHILVLVTYVCAFIWFAPLLDAMFPLFESASTWKWIFPILAIPIAFLIYYLINSLKKSKGTESGNAKITMTQFVGLLYIGALIAILVVNIIEWVNHCRSSVPLVDQYSYCYTGLGLTTQYKFVFWMFVVHLVMFSLMLWMAWYTMTNKVLRMYPAYVEGKLSGGAAAAYTQMQPINVGSSAQRTVFG